MHKALAFQKISWTLTQMKPCLDAMLFQEPSFRFLTLPVGCIMWHWPPRSTWRFRIICWPYSCFHSWKVHSALFLWNSDVINYRLGFILAWMSFIRINLCALWWILPFCVVFLLLLFFSESRQQYVTISYQYSDSSCYTGQIYMSGYNIGHNDPPCNLRAKLELMMSAIHLHSFWVRRHCIFSECV